MWAARHLYAQGRIAQRFYSTAKPHITMFTGTDCQLCEEAREVLASVATPFSLSLYNIRDDAAPNAAYWRRKYQYDIPVLHVRWEEPADAYDVGSESHRASAGKALL
ncbi:hypothetical protein MVES1_002565 [Malassezia vespertilionis]|uniref:uncharacterized protein n=1 Tax=Malassezia vespertilionis TaxID=2020962 RepID=UPI0024B17B37|nr:uncharacterized protein MVES1_002565 [Malassezia vespertilionis]WFD07206.1 hypothetical protein MVES1_002565 [Malassezia vespertilionis]